ncbi:hypothetical protein EV682_1265 [Iodobacter fluviatilis]|uniref:Uncharacterized protein n=1 Tax=Iodobacter fluviatilis TaxID=537 RepID=A0A377Q8H1_9NEIS|nr:hypothetical protein EV682_1265 [Iodobacter fluviatilis]STQ90151.1 Uncharacterised protein [Iodobacter fluviatilis]
MLMQSIRLFNVTDNFNYEELDNEVDFSLHAGRVVHSQY